MKLDNILVNEAMEVLKLCDFGNAMFAEKNEITPYLVSCFYRAPEIILDWPYDHPVDMWSVGCCLYELYMGKILFPGPSKNDMLRLHMELKGPFPKKMLYKGAFTDQHFYHDFNFHATEEDHVTKKIVKRLLLNIKPRDISARIAGSQGEEDRNILANFKDLLGKNFLLDPNKRMTADQALNHPFITGKWEAYQSLVIVEKRTSQLSEQWLRHVPTWMHSEPLNPKYSQHSQPVVLVQERSTCLSRILTSLMVGIARGALTTFIVLFMRAIFANRPAEYPVHPMEYGYEKIKIVVEKGSNDVKKVET
ncbi:hypothetical protein IFM89_017159 [Coptis chinensis]|uniref:Protein kinase domain-containing protein n=1 Tax=Coptis chinensis TaxID=261450 RepID=A0A835HR28_9MAGN|nr:hypothetical protein IFM89_017159 [Coptis chinensis]